MTAGLGALFVLCWSSGFIGAKLGAEDASVPTILMWRFLPLALVLLPFLLARRSGPQQLGARGITRQVAVGALSQSGYLLTVYWAIALGVSTGTTALIDGIQPLVVAALVGPLLGTAVVGRQWLGLVLGLAGVASVTWADATNVSSGTPWWAYAVPFGGMLCLVAATFLERRATTSTAPLHALTIHCLTSAAIFTAMAVLAGEAIPPAATSFWVAMTWLVVLSTFGGYGLYWVLLRRAGVATVNSLMFLVPPVTTVWGATMFGEPLTAMTIGGLALALVATLLVVAPRRESSRRDGQRKRRNRPGNGAGRRRAH
ncbi:DMT family transporter [Aeromicrobium phragmitis]|uniref:DMT family transporter n=1 Tax=Aeromicrobium phragmitis TaxID=2478914 RepID=A0A3L8PUB2_9ACTN|nr:DMT family transporter [Aeromicrobium phragmitis]